MAVNSGILGLSALGNGTHKLSSVSRTGQVAALSTAATSMKSAGWKGTRDFSAVVRHEAPAFSGMSYWDGEFKPISLSDFKGKYVVLFFYPADFTFVCPTEII